MATDVDGAGARHRLLVTVTGQDRPGVAAALFAALSGVDATVTDTGQITIRGHLVLCVELDCPAALAPAHVRRTVLSSDLGGDDRLSVGVAEAVEEPIGAQGRRLLVTLTSHAVTAEAMAGVFSAIFSSGGTCERIVRLAVYPVQSYELVVLGADHERLRASLATESSRLGIDLAVQRAGLHRRAKRLVVLDADSTLLTAEVIDQLAEAAGRADEVAAITETAMAGGLDFHEALARRVALLEGLPVAALAEIAARLELAPGARTLVRTLRRLGFSTAVVSGGFHEVLDAVCSELGVDRVAANRLGVREGRLTGEVLGPVVDRAGKADALRRFAAELGVPLSQTVAVGDGANDVDMIAIAGLGIAFNARPVLRDAADTAISVPYLDAVLYLLGIPREEIEAAEAHGEDRPPVRG
ncbi:MAG TPA: phosphoserine phosphatase SerB [Acidimicrobiales bacterium]|nr:phosphoserine phosphatase SerB [Acidimicrobiales bacterium]